MRCSSEVVELETKRNTKRLPRFNNKEAYFCMLDLQLCQLDQILTKAIDATFFKVSQLCKQYS